MFRDWYWLRRRSEAAVRVKVRLDDEDSDNDAMAGTSICENYNEEMYVALRSRANQDILGGVS